MSSGEFDKDRFCQIADRRTIDGVVTLPPISSRKTPTFCLVAEFQTERRPATRLYIKTITAMTSKM